MGHSEYTQFFKKFCKEHQRHRALAREERSQERLLHSFQAVSKVTLSSLFSFNILPTQWKYHQKIENLQCSKMCCFKLIHILTLLYSILEYTGAIYLSAQ
jgi:hypothetical protein